MSERLQADHVYVLRELVAELETERDALQAQVEALTRALANACMEHANHRAPRRSRTIDPEVLGARRRHLQ